MSYEIDPDNNLKMIPTGRPRSAYGRAEAPNKETFVKRPSYVTVNKEGVYGFSYANTGSIGGEHNDVDAYITGSVLDDAAGPVKLDIQPNAWKRMDGTGEDGDITFIYRGDVG